MLKEFPVLKVNTCELVNHFLNNPCDFKKDLRLYILEDSLPDDENICKFTEDKWITRLNTKEPKGMNTRLNNSPLTCL